MWQIREKIGKKFIKHREIVHERHEHCQFFTFSLELDFFPVFSRVEFISPGEGGAFGQNIYPCGNHGNAIYKSLIVEISCQGLQKISFSPKSEKCWKWTWYTLSKNWFYAVRMLIITNFCNIKRLIWSVLSSDTQRNANAKPCAIPLQS